MPTPPKPYLVLMQENKSHRTKDELEQRKKGEEQLSTGTALKEHSETKKNDIAHKEFKRINTLLKTINKNDALYENIINRYAIIYAECIGFANKRERFYKNITDLEEKYAMDIDSMSITEYFSMQRDLEKSIIDLDRQIQNKRKMMLDIEKENIMTIASTLRTIPKKDTSKENSPLLKALRGD